MSLEGVSVKKELDYDAEALPTLKCEKESDGYLSLLTDAYSTKAEPKCDGGSLLTNKYMKEEHNCEGDSLLTSTNPSECDKFSLPTSSYCAKEPKYDGGLIPNTCFIKEELDLSYGVSEAAARAGLYADHLVKEELVLGPELVQSRADAVQDLLGLSQVETRKQRPGSESTCNRHTTLRDCFVKLDRIPIDKLDTNTRSGDRHSHVQADNVENRNNISQISTKRIYICNTCSKQFVVRKLFIMHLRKHKSDKPFECDVCGRNYSEKIHLMKHSLIHVIDKETNICNTCNKRFMTRSALVNHIRKHLAENMCEICYKSFASAHSLDRHKLIHTGERPFTCDTCQIQFRYKEDLVVHIKEHRGKLRVNLSCDICSKQFSHVFQLVHHKRSHTNENPFQCDICKRSFSATNNLKKHKFTHVKERPFPCDLCDRQFVRRDNLNKHKQSHTGEKPFNCEICDKAFRSRENLVYHLRIHSQANIIKPYSCEICGNTFRIRSHLTRHTRTHTGEKPFTCNICEKSFRHKTTLTSHTRTHTGQRPYACDMCSHKSITSSNLQQHKRKAHYLAK